ncbi:MAG TPA: hypothetical protein VJ044_07735, partial [Candidatus Hodarchaeales archaeon]|nr:hypothetical protein [Candidatus Hodarchaeales archaeon]
MSTPDRDLDDITGHKDSDRGRNVRISGRAWEIIRWTKYELRTTSYSETIQRLYTNIAKDRKSRLIES